MEDCHLGYITKLKKKTLFIIYKVLITHHKFSPWMDVSLNSNVSKYGLQLVLNDIVNYFCEAHGGY
jgi:hypothetical protein